MSPQPPALTEADRDAYRDEIDRLTEKIEHLREANAELKRRESRVREYWFPWPGSIVGDHLGVSVHTLDGEHWSIRSHYAYGGAFVYIPDRWYSVQDIDHATAYQWTLGAAEPVARRLAAADALRLGSQPTLKVNLVKDLGRVAEAALAASQELLGAVAAVAS
jgi:hypothetical protein